MRSENNLNFRNLKAFNDAELQEFQQKIEKSREQNKIASENISKFFKNLSVKEITVTTIAGYCVGYFVRDYVRQAMYATGAGVLTLIVLDQNGIYKLPIKKIEEKAVEIIDEDGDGKITAKDFVIKLKRWVKLQGDKQGDKAPSLAGFVSGMMQSLT